MNNLTNWLLAIIIVLMLGGGVYWIYSTQNKVKPNVNNPTTSATPAPSAAPQGKLTKPISADDWTKGPADAQIQLVAYEDFQCPGCRQLSPIFASMVDKFPGKVSFTFRHYPLSFHQFAAPAAELAEAAGAQGKFWEMYEYLMTDGSMSVDNAYTYAKDKLGLDADRMKQEVESNKYADKINGMEADGTASGVTGTPSLYLNGDLLSWDQTTAIEQTIQNKLK